MLRSAWNEWQSFSDSLTPHGRAIRALLLVPCSYYLRVISFSAVQNGRAFPLPLPAESGLFFLNLAVAAALDALKIHFIYRNSGNSEPSLRTEVETLPSMHKILGSLVQQKIKPPRLIN